MLLSKLLESYIFYMDGAIIIDFDEGKPPSKLAFDWLENAIEIYGPTWDASRHQPGFRRNCSRIFWNFQIRKTLSGSVHKEVPTEG